MSINQINVKDFRTEVLKAHKLTLVLFWAPWSRPSRELFSSLKDIGDTYSENVNIVAINVDHAGELPEYYSVLHVPSVLYFWRGKQIGRTDGLVSIVDLEYVIEKIIEKLLKVHRKTHEVQ
jgi:thioredoxin-like negative regulator of GroEL